jgi:hypothetical protein
MILFIYHIVGFSFIIVIKVYKIILGFINFEFLNCVFLTLCLLNLVYNKLLKIIALSMLDKIHMHLCQFK